MLFKFRLKLGFMNVSFFERIHLKTRKNAIVEYLDYQIPVSQLSQGPNGNGGMQAAKRD